MASVTNSPRTMSYFVQDITEVLTDFNRLMWFRSADGEHGTYEALTDTTAQPAILVGRNSEPHALAGLTLRFRVNGVSDVEVTFAGSDPYTTADAAAEIEAEAPALVTADVDADGHLTITSVQTGTGASVDIQEDTEASLNLGFQLGDAAIGRDPHQVLVSGTHEYLFTDQNSDDDWWYRVQYHHSVSLDLSEFSVSFPATSVQPLPYSATIVGFVRLADAVGRPLAGRRVVLSPQGMLTSGSHTVFGEPLYLTTDRNGYAEIRVVRGTLMDVNVEGTGYTRRIEVPDTGDGFDFMDPDLVTEDELGIVVSTWDFAIRTS